MVRDLHGERLMKKGKRFLPLYCPNKDCQHHRRDSKSSAGVFWISRGYEKRKLSASVRNFQCKSCKKRFCSNYFSESYNYKKKSKKLQRSIFEGVARGLSNRAIGRELGVSEGLVRLRRKNAENLKQARNDSGQSP